MKIKSLLALSRKSIALALFSGLTSFPLFSQWTALTSGTTADLNSVFFTDEQNGWIAGKSGVLRHTTDGGSTWAAQSAGTSKDIYCIHFANATTGWLSGKEGTIKATTDGGATWTTQSTGVNAKLNAIHFSDASHGIAVGEEGTILTTTNGGATWIIRAGNAGSGSSSSEGNDLYDVQMLSADVAYACGKDGAFIKTTNGGVNWVSQNSTVTEDLEALHFPSAGRGYTCYELGKVKQTNGTGTFTSVYAATSKDLKDLWFINDNRGWVIGDEGRILLTDNGGASWTSHNVNTTEELTSIHFPSAFTGYIAGKGGLLFKLIHANLAGINEPEDFSAAVRLYPNPAAQELNILLEQPLKGEAVDIRIIDQQGKIVQQQKSVSTAGPVSIDLSALQSGLYTVQLVSGSLVATQKIVKP